MTFLEKFDKAKLQRFLLIAISALVLVALALLLVIIVMSINPSGLKDSDMEFTELKIEEKDLTTGTLLLADADHPFNAGATLISTMTNCQEYRNNNRGDIEKGPYYTMNNVQLSSIAIGAAHNLLVAAENSVKGNDLLIKCAYNANDDKTDEYNTGLLMLLTNYDEEKLPEAYANWLDNNAVKYGFIESFDDAYRYVGVAHAGYMAKEKLTLANYIAYLKENTSNEKGLFIKASNGSEYYIYYVSAKAGDSIKVPAEKEGTYTISGTNEGGIIVTCELK